MAYKKKLETPQHNSNIEILTVLLSMNELLDSLNRRQIAMEAMMQDFIKQQRTSIRITTFGLRSTIPFGKYAGHSVKTVCRMNPNYIHWMIGNIPRISFEREVFELLELLDA
jgi:hypothetical protein